MKFFTLAFLVTPGLSAQTDPAVLAQQLLTAVQTLEAQLSAANAKNVALTAMVTDLQGKVDLGALIDGACQTCRAVLTSVLTGKTNQVGNWLYGGPTTVPPTPPGLPSGYSLIVISPEQAAAPAPAAVLQR